jgi:hypothetical protein
MSREEIIRMAREAGIDAESDTLCRYEGWVEPIERFAALVAKHAVSNIDPASWMSYQEGRAAGAAAEREACAKTADCWAEQRAGEEIAAAIRARGKK